MFTRHLRFLLLVMLMMFTILSLNAKSKLAYMGLSVLVPGSGELAIGRTNRGLALLSVEILAEYGFFKTDSDMDLQEDSYKRYANIYAGVPIGMPNNHYQVVQNYISSEEYNEFQDMQARNYFYIYQNDEQAYLDYLAANTYTGNESWEWQSEMHFREYREMRRKYQKIKINHNLSLGIMLLNRAISLVDMALITRDMKVYAAPMGLDGMTINYQVRF
nr:hypothetical protein [Candidatus Cloacimonadota bacterium]